MLVGGQFVGIGKDGRTVVAAETDPRNAHDFEFITNGSKVRIKAPNGRFLQVLYWVNRFQFTYADFLFLAFWAVHVIIVRSHSTRGMVY